MVSRKSTGKASTSTGAANLGASPIASSSRIRLDMIPPFDVPTSVTPDYAPGEIAAIELDDEDRQRLVYELTGIRPRGLLEDFTEVARLEIYSAVETVEAWAREVTDQNDGEMEREINIGLHQLETLLESHTDKALDKFTAWSLRNPFNIAKELEPVLPWHRGMNFSRGEYVSTLPQGEETVRSSIEALRTEVEQARYLYQQLETAEKALDRRLDIAKQRKAEVGFIQELLTASDISNLPETAASMVQSLAKLHTTVSPMSLDPPSVLVGQGNGTKAWELGRQAYLNWAVGKMLSQAGSGGGGAAPAAGAESGAQAGSADDRVEAVESELRQIGDHEGIEAAMKAVGP